MWWCCGKTTKDAPGCKYSKHYCKEDEDENEGEAGPSNGQTTEITVKKTNIRCLCCKEKGHNIDECLRDPNIRTQQDVLLEEKRIAKSKSFRKLLSDSLGMTSRLFKGLIRRQAGTNDLNPFSKGAMSFDDYSYKYFNEHVLNTHAITEQTREHSDSENNDDDKGKDARINKQVNESEHLESDLTVDHMRDFEQHPDHCQVVDEQWQLLLQNEAHADQALNTGQSLSNFIPKEVIEMKRRSVLAGGNRVTF